MRVSRMSSTIIPEGEYLDFGHKHGIVSGGVMSARGDNLLELLLYYGSMALDLVRIPLREPL